MAVTTATLERDTDRRRVLIVDDHRIFADMLAWSLEGAGMTPVATASSAAEAVALAAELQPDVVVMDIGMPCEDGLSATRRIREVAPDAIVAIVTAHRHAQWVALAAQAGASAFIPKDGSLTEMMDVLGHVRPGHLLVAPSTFAGDHPESDPPPSAPEAELVLTRREREVLEYLGRGMHVTAIARRLGIGEETCRGYVKSLRAKLGVGSQLQAVLRAQELGLLAARADAC
jgi:DNA-binding NarL/FixJ family response regulator